MITSIFIESLSVKPVPLLRPQKDDESIFVEPLSV